MKQRRSRGVFALLLVWVGFAPLTALGSQASTQDQDPTFVKVTRDVHHFRHWTWSGIFPLYGGWIPDPHFLVTSVFEFPADVQELLGEGHARYQGVDVNPWFNDASSEVVLAIEANGTVYEYRVPRTPGRPHWHGFMNNGDLLIAFPHGRGVAFLTSLDISENVFLTIGLPLAPGRSVEVVREGSASYAAIVQELRESGRYRSLSSTPCRRIRWFYEQLEPCPKD